MSIRTSPRADGDAGARRAAALLSIAVCAETTNSTLSEDYKKIDLKLSFEHALKKGLLVTVLCQVKSGPSFVSTRGTESRTIRVNEATKEALAEGDCPVLLAWVPPKPSSRVYWYAVTPRAPVASTVYIPDDQYVTPYLRFYLSRISKHGRHAHGRALMEAKTGSIPEIHTAAKAAYKRLKDSANQNPLLGEVAITRFAWRHVTRRSKATTARLSALRITPYLKNIIAMEPDRYLTGAPVFRNEGAATVETRNALLVYRKALKIDGELHTVRLRIRDEIRYPTEWYKYPLSANDVHHSATLASWWSRPSSER